MRVQLSVSADMGTPLFHISGPTATLPQPGFALKGRRTRQGGVYAVGDESLGPHALEGELLLHAGGALKALWGEVCQGGVAQEAAGARAPAAHQVVKPRVALAKVLDAGVQVLVSLQGKSQLLLRACLRMQSGTVMAEQCLGYGSQDSCQSKGLAEVLDTGVQVLICLRRVWV